VRVLALGSVPSSDSFPLIEAPLPDPAWPLELWMCCECTLLQLGPAAEMPPEQPGPVDSATAIAHAEASVAEVLRAEGLRPGATFAEHDSSHGGSWASYLVGAGLRRVGPDEPADLVLDVHNLMHETDLDQVVSARAAQLRPGGCFVAEFFHGLPMVEQTLADTVRHGHYSYLTLTAALPLLERHGLVVTRATRNPAYGGSLRITARRPPADDRADGSVESVLASEAAAGLDGPGAVTEMAGRVSGVAGRVRARIAELRDGGARVAGYGAPSKAAVLLALTGVDDALLPYTVDRSPAKHGRRVPGAGIPIRPVEHLLDDRPDVVVVLTWDIAEEVATQLGQLADGSGWQPTLFVPLPRPRELRLPGGRA
jgi:hypothetical protein